MKSPCRVRKCCVKGCEDVTSKRHRFPKNNPELFKTWIDTIQPNNWEKLSVEQIYNRHFVCHAHFEECYHLNGSLRGLTVHAVPTLGVPGLDDSLSKPSTFEVKIEIAHPEESERIMEIETHESSKPEGLQNFSEPTTHELDFQFYEYSTAEPVEEATQKLAERKISLKRADSILSELNCTRKGQLTGREQILYNMVCKLRRRLIQKNLQIKTYRERLRVAQKLISNEGFRNLSS